MPILSVIPNFFLKKDKLQTKELHFYLFSRRRVLLYIMVGLFDLSGGD